MSKNLKVLVVLLGAVSITTLTMSKKEVKQPVIEEPVIEEVFVEPEVVEIPEPPKGFRPSTVLTVKQESLCTKIAVYGETRNSSLEEAEYIMWVIINRAMDNRRDSQYRGTSCGVITAKRGLQFEGVKNHKVIEDIVWGLNLNHVPSSAKKKSTPDSIAWKHISDMVDKAYRGELERKTIATHFVNLQQLKGPIKDWIKDLKPVGVSSNHFLFVDYETVNGKQVFFTKEKPFRVSFNWQDFDKSVSN